MRCQLLFFVFFCGLLSCRSSVAVCQAVASEDSLLTLLKSSTDSRAKAGLYNALFIELIKKDPATAKTYAQKQVTLAKQEGLRKELAQGLNNLSVYYINQGDLDSAKLVIDEVVAAYQLIGDRAGIGSAFQNLGNLYRQKGDFTEAIEAYRRAAQSYAETGDRNKEAGAVNGIGNAKRNLGELDSALFFYQTALSMTDTATIQAVTFMNIGNVYAQQGKYEQSVEYHLQSIKIKEALDDTRGLMSSYVNMGVIYSRLNQFDKSDAAYHKAIALAEQMGVKASAAMAYNNIGTNKARQEDFDSAAYYFRKSLVIREGLGNKMEIGMSQNNLGNVYRDLGKYDSALYFHQLALASKLEASDRYGLPSAYYNIGSILSSMKRKEAEEYILKGYGMAKEVSPVLEQEAAKILFDHYMSTGSYQKAVDIQSRMIALKDSIGGEETKQRIQELETKYEAEKKDKEIALLAKDNELKAQEIQKAKTEKLLYGLSGLFLVTIGGGFFYVQRKRHQVAMSLAEKEKLVYDQKIRQLLEESEITRIEALLKGQEEERKRMARELHDGLGGMLAALKISLQSDSKKGSSLDQALLLAEKSADEVRKISHNLMAGALKKYGLVEALKDLARQVSESTNLELKLYFDKHDYPLNPESETHLFRILQEIISNCLKHAQARELAIQFHQEGETLHVTTEDDGVGFDQSKTNAGIGLDNIRDRTEALHANLALETSAGSGCTYFIDIPLKVNQLI